MIDQILAALIGSGPVAGVLAYGLWVVWGRYQAALDDLSHLERRLAEDYRRLAGLEQQHHDSHDSNEAEA